MAHLHAPRGGDLAQFLAYFGGILAEFSILPSDRLSPTDFGHIGRFSYTEGVTGGALASLGTPRGPQTPPEDAATLVYASVSSPSVASMFTNHPGALRGTQTPAFAPQV